MKILLFTVLFLGLYQLPALAHPGNTQSDGCHYCRTNCAKWGEVQGARHCHNAKINYTPPSYTAPSYTPPTYSPPAYTPPPENTQVKYPETKGESTYTQTYEPTSDTDDSWLIGLLFFGGLAAIPLFAKKKS